MSTEIYPVEELDPEYDDGTMPENVDELRKVIVGHKIVKAEVTELSEAEFGHFYSYRGNDGLILTLDDGRRVALVDTDDCCAYTTLQSFLLHPEAVDHMVTNVATTDGYQTWHILADFGEIMKLEVGWSAGNPFYYGYGFHIRVSNVIEGEVVEATKELEA